LLGGAQAAVDWVVNVTEEPLSTVVPGAGAEEITVVPSPCMSPTVRLLV